MIRLDFSAAVLASALFLTQSLPVQAGDWPQWRGPRRDGISTETGLLQSWPAGGPPLAWKAAGLGAGHATVAVAGGRIVTMGDADGSSHIHCLNEKDGKLLWSAKVGKAGAPGWGGFAGPRSTPTISGDHVIALGQYGELACFTVKDGKEVWRRSYDVDFGGPLPEWGFSESVLVDGNKVICTPGGSQGALVALDLKTGKEVWRCKEFKDPAHYSSPIAVEIDGVPQYIQLTALHVVGVAAKDGKLLWQAPRKGATAVIPTPIYNDNHVYVTSGYGTGCNLFRISKEVGGFKATEVYQNKTMVNHHGGVILVDAHVYGHSDAKGWTCQELKTGKEVWQGRDKTRVGKGSVVFADGRLYCRQEDGKGTIALIEASPAGYKEHGRLDQPERSDKNSWAHPVVANGRLFIRDQDRLFAFDVKRK